METKIFEIRDAGTFIVAYAARIGAASGETARERWLISRGGWEHGTVALTRLGSVVETETDSFAWQTRTGTRTMQVAHYYIAEHWDDLKSGDLICVETILRLRTEPKETEQERAPDYARQPGGLLE